MAGGAFEGGPLLRTTQTYDYLAWQTFGAGVPSTPNNFDIHANPLPMQLMEYEDSLEVGETHAFLLPSADNEHLPNGCLMLSNFSPCIYRRMM